MFLSIFTLLTVPMAGPPLLPSHLAQESLASTVDLEVESLERALLQNQNGKAPLMSHGQVQRMNHGPMMDGLLLTQVAPSLESHPSQDLEVEIAAKEELSPRQIAT